GARRRGERPRGAAAEGGAPGIPPAGPRARREKPCRLRLPPPSTPDGNLKTFPPRIRVPNQVLMADSIQGLRPDGRFVLMGFEAKPLPVSPADLIVRRIKIVGSQQNGREYLCEALDYVATGKVKVIAETYPLVGVNRA